MKISSLSRLVPVLFGTLLLATAAQSQAAPYDYVPTVIYVAPVVSQQTVRPYFTPSLTVASPVSMVAPRFAVAAPARAEAAQAAR